MVCSHLVFGIGGKLTPTVPPGTGDQGADLDVDNTLTTHDNPQPKEEVGEWLDRMREAGI